MLKLLLKNLLIWSPIMKKSVFLTENENTLYYSKSLAKAIGLKECMVLTEIINAKKSNGFYVNISSIGENTLTFIDNSTLKRIVKKLETLNLIKKVDADKDSILAVLKSKPIVIGVGNNVCSICNCTTAQLHQHHYPIRKSEGGTKTISLCPNCHFEFHYMEFDYEINYELIEKYLIASN